MEDEELNGPNNDFPDETIYAISARVKNQASAAINSNLTGVGVQLCNLYTHVMKNFYNFSHTLSEEDRKDMISLIRKSESMPGDFIALINESLIQNKIQNDKMRKELFDTKLTLSLLEQDNERLFKRLEEEKNKSLFTRFVEWFKK